VLVANHTTQDSIYGCLLDFAIVTISSDQSMHAFHGANAFVVPPTTRQGSLSHFRGLLEKDSTNL